MGGLMGGGGGGGKSGNHAWDEIKDTYYPMAQKGVGGYNMLGNLLGLNGGAANSEALDSYWKSAGGKFQLDEGLDALTSKFAAQGLSKSGAAMKGMEQYRQGLASTYLNNYLGQLGNYSQMGLGAGNLLANAGQYSKGQAGGGGGAGALIGGILSALPMVFPSSRELKTKIERIGEWDERGDGLGLYRFAYRWAPNEMLEGVMADEVERLRPAAFVPNFYLGKPGVNYAMLGVA